MEEEGRSLKRLEFDRFLINVFADVAIVELILKLFIFLNTKVKESIIKKMYSY